MDEQTIKFLELNGYQYYNGAILDKDGKYISTLELRGKTINSEVDENFYNQDRKVAEKNQKNADLKSQFKNFENDPISKSIAERAKQVYPVLDTQKREPEIIVYNPISNSKKLNMSSNKTKKLDFLFYDYPVVLAVSIIIYLLIKRIIK
jgi:hypothetical protein